MFHENLVQLRKLHQMTQEALAEKVGVSRQAIAKWESGETVPDLEKGRILAQVFDISLDDLANYDPADNCGLALPPRGKHLFGVVTVGDKGQIVIPAKARKLFGLECGSRLVILGDEAQGLALMKAEDFLGIAEMIRNTK